MSSGSKPTVHRLRKVLDPPAIVSGDLEDQHIRSRGKNTKQTQFLPSQLQSMSYGLFSTRRGPGKKGEKRADVESRGTPACPSRRQAALTTFEPRSGGGI